MPGRGAGASCVVGRSAGMLYADVSVCGMWRVRGVKRRQRVRVGGGRTPETARGRLSRGHRVWSACTWGPRASHVRSFPPPRPRAPARTHASFRNGGGVWARLARLSLPRPPSICMLGTITRTARMGLSARAKAAILAAAEDVNAGRGDGASGSKAMSSDASVRRLLFSRSGGRLEGMTCRLLCSD